jgi:hypothetical protein
MPIFSTLVFAVVRWGGADELAWGDLCVLVFAAKWVCVCGSELHAARGEG